MEDKTEEHHRRPRSIGGTDHAWNKSTVPGSFHKCWHTLFGSMNACQICEKINDLEYIPRGVEVECVFLSRTQVKQDGKHDSKDRKKISDAWFTLFSGMSFRNIIKYINDTWIDPCYELRIIE